MTTMLRCDSRFPAKYERQQLSFYGTFKSRKLSCIPTTLCEIFICCTLYTLFIILEHAESSNERIQVEKLPEHFISQRVGSNWEEERFKHCCVLLVFIFCSGVSETTVVLNVTSKTFPSVYISETFGLNCFSWLMFLLLTSWSVHVPRPATVSRPPDFWGFSFCTGPSHLWYLALA